MNDNAGADVTLPLASKGESRMTSDVADPTDLAVHGASVPETDPAPGEIPASEEVSGYDKATTADSDVADLGGDPTSAPAAASRPSVGWADDLAACKRCASESDNADKVVKERAHALLRSVYAFHQKYIRDAKDLTAFCKQHESLFAYDKKFEKNPFTPLFKAIHPTAVKQVTSIRSRALLYALRQGVAEPDLIEFMGNHHGIEGCAKLATTKNVKCRGEAGLPLASRQENASETDAPSNDPPAAQPGFLVEGMPAPERDGLYAIRVQVIGGRCTYVSISHEAEATS